MKPFSSVAYVLANTHTLREQTHRQITQPYLLAEGVRELHEVALTLVIIVHSERMSRSEPRKPLDFPQRGRKEERAKWVKGGWRGQMEREKGVTKCVPNEKRRQDEKDYLFPGSTLLTFKGPFCGSCTSVPFQPSSSSLTNNTHWHGAGQFSSNSQPEMNPSRCCSVKKKKKKSMLGYHWWKHLM